LFLGTYSGPERDLAVKDKINFQPMLSGKWRRYFSLRNFFDLLVVFLAFWQSFYLLLKYRPALIISAGSFVSVPLVWAGKLLGIKSIVHQQDWRAGLANKLMARSAAVITVALEKSLFDYGNKARWIGNPIKEIDPAELAVWQKQVREKYQITDNEKLILIIGGGTGSVWLNRLGEENAKWLSQLGRVVHSCGRGRQFSAPASYSVIEFIPHQELLALESLATLVISRCGLGLLTEICHFRLPGLLIPMPESHQEDNARYFAQYQAALVLAEKNYSLSGFQATINDLLNNDIVRQELQANLGKIMKPEAAKNLAQIIQDLA